MTFSLVGRSANGDEWGVAVASKFLAVGCAVPAAAAGIGAIATQADANVAYKRDGMAQLALGRSAADTIATLLGGDDGREDRQLGVVDRDGRGATHTGARCFAWAGGVAGDGYAIQGNVLEGPEVITAMERAWRESDPGSPLARRLMTALAAGDAAGGDRRGRQSAALLVARDGAGYGGGDDVAVDLRVDDHPDPVTELSRLLDLNDLYLTASTAEEQVAITPALSDEIARLVTGLGHGSLRDWVGTENYEMRVAQDGSWIDRRILAILRDTAGT